MRTTTASATTMTASSTESYRDGTWSGGVDATRGPMKRSIGATLASCNRRSFSPGGPVIQAVDTEVYRDSLRSRNSSLFPKQSST